VTCMLATPEGLLFTGSAAGGVDVWRLSSLAHLTVIPPPASAGMLWQNVSSEGAGGIYVGS